MIVWSSYVCSVDLSRGAIWRWFTAPAVSWRAATARRRGSWSANDAARTARDPRDSQVRRRRARRAFPDPALHGVRKAALVSTRDLPVLRRRDTVGGSNRARRTLCLFDADARRSAVYARLCHARGREIGRAHV